VDDEERPGRRIARARKAQGLTQQQLADAARVSKSMLAKVEGGHASASNGWLGAIAAALGVDVGYLTGAPYAAGEPDAVNTHRLIPPVRRALASWDLLQIPDDVRPMPIDELAREVAKLSELRHLTAYDRLGAALPVTLQNLVVATMASDTEQDRERAFALLTMAYRAANTLAHKLGYVDLSLTALDRMDWAAAHAHDPLLVAIVDYVRAGALSRIGERDGALQLLMRAMNVLDGMAGSSDEALAILGCLHMKAIAIYGTMGDAERVATHAAQAGRIARGRPDILVADTPFGPANVGLHALSAQVDLGNAGEALKVAEGIQLPGGMTRERQTYFHMDLARARLLANDPDGAVEALYTARTVAPLHFANSATARGAIASIASRQRTAGGGLRALAHSVGISD
jgi:transcriptional regulator with XRE-family HTH domain